jgi:hypothetical protein
MSTPPSARHTREFVAVALTVVFFACSSSGVSAVPSDGKVPLGTWGGDDAGMIVGDTAMHLHVGCTYGDVSGRIVVDANGRFDVTGNYLLRAYPVAVGPTMPARFIGRVEGSVTTVTVTVNDTVQHATVVKGPVVVEFGEAPRLGPCPICRRPVLTHVRG